MSAFTAEQIQEIKRIVSLEVVKVNAPTPYDLRLRKGFHKVSTLSKMAGVHRDLIRKYEGGYLKSVHDSTYENFKLIATVLEVTPEEYSSAVQRRVDAVRAATRN